MNTAQMDVRDLAELIVRRLADEQIKPLNDRLQGLAERFVRVETAVVGNGVPSLSKQLAEVGARCEAEHHRLHQRISAKRDGDGEGKKNGVLRERLTGAWMALSAAGTIAFAAFQIWSYFKGGR